MAASTAPRSFSRDVVWNLVALGIAGVFGVAVNYLVAYVYHSAALGVFNQVFAIYLVGSQLGALGVHGSVLTHVAAEQDEQRRPAIVSSALVLTAGLGTLVALAMVALAAPIGGWVESERVETGLYLAAPGVVCFALNKVGLATLNGLRRMRLYATFQASRVVMMALGFAGCVAYDRTSSGISRLPISLTIGEGVTLIAVIVSISDVLRWPSRAELRHWVRTHLGFGLRGFLSSLLSDVGSRIEVIILGVYASDEIVGAYSMAAIVVEGMAQALVALGANYAPIVIRHLHDGTLDELRQLTRRGIRRTYAVAAVVGAVAVAGYALVVPLITRDPELASSWRYFGLLTLGLVLGSGYVPFNQFLLWARRPGWHTILSALTLAFSALVNVVAVARYGALGAAAAIGSVWLVAALLLRTLSRRLVGVRL